MAAPIIDEVLAPSSVLTGESFDLQVVAHDPDSRPGDILIRVIDSQGQAVEATWNVKVGDPLSYFVSDPDAFGWIITQDGNDPSLFHITAP